MRKKIEGRKFFNAALDIASKGSSIEDLIRRNYDYYFQKTGGIAFAGLKKDKNK
jgi:hypothetical protein